MNEILAKKIKELPSQSGVYIMRNNKNEVIYVGKAKNLKNRVSQYFHLSQKHPKVQLMVENIADFEYIITPSELDAFILENSLIKKYQPFFNILLKDGKQYPYIKVNLNEKFPTFAITRKIKKDGAKYYGPYFGSIKADEILKTINYAYPIRTCGHNFENGKTLKRECLNYSLGLCCAPCTRKVSDQQYLNYVKSAIKFLQGNEKEVIKILEEKMKLASESENFEVAIVLRDRIKMAKELASRAVVDLAKDESCDVVAFASDGISSCANVLIVRNGKILGSKNYSLIDGSLNKEQGFETFLMQLYSQDVIIPKNIYINNNVVNCNLISEALSSLNEKAVKILVPQKGTHKKLVEMSEKNAFDFLQKSLTSEKKKYNESIGAIEKLKEVLNEKSNLERIECYDISHISGTLKVGSMVVFENGMPAKKMYRKFKIKTVEGNNDFACLKEVLSRRVFEFESGEDLSFLKKPDLIVIDGGKGQLSSVCEVLEGTIFKDVSIISLAEREEEIFVPHEKNSIKLPKGSLGLRILQNIRDEAHRFAITYHKSLRNKKQLESSFDQIKGIGKILKQRLYEKFVSAENVRSKSVQELMGVEGISKQKAIQILKQLN